jgi:hypothetical protein
MSENKVGHVSASSISSFKACPIRYRIAYVEGLRVAQEPQPLRFGTAWHKGLQVLAAPLNTISSDCGPGGNAPPVRITEENRLEIAVELATDVYTTVPDWADPTEWAVERETIAAALAVYHWLYPLASSEYETVATELQFDLPLVNPETGRPTPNYRRVGQIDRVIRSKANGCLLIQEHKSTSKSIDSGSTYWLRLRKDTQSKFYINAGRDLQSIGDKGLDPRAISGLLHDVFHKPGIKPSKLTQAESAEFVKTGDYCGQKFEVQYTAPSHNAMPLVTGGQCLVDGIAAEIEPGKKEGTFALRETPGMFGTRLLQDMTARPEFYFARKEVAFTDQELLAFQYQVWALQRNMSEMERTGFWWENEQQCEATFKCAYCSLCYNNVDVFNGQTPPEFKRLRAEVVQQTEEGVGE